MISFAKCTCKRGKLHLIHMAPTPSSLFFYKVVSRSKLLVRETSMMAWTRCAVEVWIWGILDFHKDTGFSVSDVLCIQISHRLIEQGRSSETLGWLTFCKNTIACSDNKRYIETYIPYLPSHMLQAKCTLAVDSCFMDLAHFTLSDHIVRESDFRTILKFTASEKRKLTTERRAQSRRTTTWGVRLPGGVPTYNRGPERLIIVCNKGLGGAWTAKAPPKLSLR
jgi:hypothetical protein